ncbi:MAG: hypothetical protein GX049_11715 [Alcaligenaceae bacterium]|nr:hypothetical protein [Alcaligenaceae bacterium]
MHTVTRALCRGLAAGALMIASGLLPAAAEPSTFDVTVLAATCANCHGTDGRSPGSIPSIAGRPETILAAQLNAYRSDTPPAGTTIMNRLVKNFDDAQIEALARHFASIKATQPKEAASK